MQYNVNTVAEYIEALSENRKKPVEQLRQVILTNFLMAMLNKYHMA